jgi:hypothetical protein
LATYQYVDVVIVAPVAPSLTSQPGNVTAVVGQSATFSVMASGTAPLSYQWRKNGANIANATSASYTIASVQTGDAAGYSVFVSNTAGNVTSNPATLTVSAMQPIRLAVKYWQANDWPDITVDHYEDYWVDGNWVEGHEEEVWGWDENWNWVSTMQWVDGYQEEGHTESQWVGSTTYPDGQFGYRWDTTIGTFDIATAASGYNATTANRGYFLNAYNPGDKITFHLHATAPSANCSNYTWALFAPSGAQITGYWFSGITACSFDANYGAGYYRIDVSYQSATGVTPANATVSYYIPVGVSPPATPVVTSSLTASGTTGIAFNYTLTASNSPTSFATAGLPTGLSLNTANGAITGTPIIAGISNVTLTASNPSGSSPAVTLVLTVANGVPTISSSLTASGTTGTAFAYVITASNSPTSYSATSLPAGLALNVTTGAITGTPTAAGAFSVGLTATNAGGTSPSATLVLTIAGGAPTITTQPASQTVAVGQSVSFTVVAAGTPTPTYQWRKGGAALANGGVINGATSATLTISGVVAGDAGNYDVVALNSAGSATSGVVTLTVLPSGDDGTPQLKVFQPN